MAANVEEALKKVTAFPGVKAAFVFNQFLHVVAREVPGSYGNEVLQRIASQLHQLTLLSWDSGLVTQEFRLVYDRYAVYSRTFGANLYLVVFMDKDTQAAEFRQPLNLAVLVLEKAFRKAEDVVEGGTLSQIASLAEQTLRSAAERDESFAGSVRKVCFTFLGSLGRDLVDLIIEEEGFILPLRSEKEMRRLAERVIERVVHPLKRLILQQDLDDLLHNTLKLQ